MDDITHASAAQSLLAELAAMKTGPEIMAFSDSAKEQAEAVIASYVSSMGADDVRSGQIAARVAKIIVKHVAAALDDPVGDEVREHQALVHSIAEIFAQENLSA